MTSTKTPEWTRELPSEPGIYEHRNLENAKGRAPIPERVVFVGYVNWPEDQKLGHGTSPMPLGSGKLRAVRIEHPMTTDCLTVQEWGGEWRFVHAVSPRASQAEPVAQAYEAVRKQLMETNERLSGSGRVPDGCSYCTNPLFVGAKCKNCGRVSADHTEQAQQEKPMPPRLLQSLARRNFRAPTDMDDLIAMAANIIAEDGTVISHLQSKLAASVTESEPVAAPTKEQCAQCTGTDESPWCELTQSEWCGRSNPELVKDASGTTGGSDAALHQAGAAGLLPDSEIADVQPPDPIKTNSWRRHSSPVRATGRRRHAGR